MTTVEVIEALTAEERRRRDELDAIIEKHGQSVFEWGMAMVEYRGKRLYREHYATFEECMRDKFDMGRNYVNKIIAAGQVVERLGTVVPKPANEAQVRPLLRIAPPMQPKVWGEVVRAAVGGSVTARLVSRVANRMVPPPKKSPAKPVRPPDCTLMDAWNERLTWMIDQAEKAKKEGWDEEVRSNVPSALRYILELLEGRVAE